MADGKKIIAGISGAVILAAGIWIGKPPADVKQLPSAVLIEAEDAKVVPTHIDTTWKDIVEIKGKDTIYKSVVDKILQVPESIERPQIAYSPDSIFRSGDIYRVTIYRNDSVMFEQKTTIAAKPYPKNSALKAYNYTQWVPSLEGK